MSQQFSQIYERLNPTQRRAVDTIEGPVMVVAGPGTGKTQVLAARIANILQKTDTNSSSILALTFTDSAAKEMRERLVRMIGKEGYYVHIQTFHAFCSEVIRTHPEYFPIDRGSEPLTDLERYDLFQQLIEDANIEVLKPLNRPYFYITDIMKAISDLKKEGIEPETFKSIVAAEREEFDTHQDELKKSEKEKQEKNLSKWHELLLIYQTYQRKLREKLRYDFDDMISLVVSAFSSEELLLREYQENLHYFLVDEYQDTNSAQNTVVDLLASYWVEEQPNIFVVGDPNQAIYRFQGASVENVLGFMTRYPSAEVITLEYGYRCPQLVYDAAAHLVGYNRMTSESGALGGFSFTDPLLSQTNEKGLLAVYAAPSQTLEIVYIAEHIKQLQKTGVPLEEIAVLYRHNRDVVELQSTLEKWGIRYEIDGGDNLLEEEHIRQLLTLFTVINDVKSGVEDEQLYEVMLYDWIGLDKTLVMKIGRGAGKRSQSIVECIENGYEAFSVFDLGVKTTPLEFETLTRFVARLKEWAALDSQVVFPEWFERVSKESGYLEWIKGRTVHVELLNHINSLFGEVKALAHSTRGLKLEGFLQAIATMQDHGIKLSVEDLNVSKDAVHLSTVHRAKGREWSYVFVMHCLDGKWGNNRARELLPLPEGVLKHTDLSKKEQNEDERRLFYVALTRAKKQVMLTYPDTIVTTNRSQSVVGSMFLEELAPDEDAQRLTRVEAPELIAKADEFLVRLLEPTTVTDTSSHTEAFFRELIKNFKLSPTTLNKYLQDPKAFVEDSLLKIPRAKAEHLAFGSAMHSALELFIKAYMEVGTLPKLEELIGYFHQALTKELLVTKDFNRRLREGTTALTRYYEMVQGKKIEPLFAERLFGSGWSKTYLDDIALSGKIDRVDWIDKTAKTVRVIDYKTGKAKSANEIEGKTVSANLSAREQGLSESIRGPYKRQLLFYKLLTQLDPTFVPLVTEGVFEFVQPTGTGKLVSRVFELKESDVEDLKDLIRAVMVEIRSLAFLELL